MYFLHFFWNGIVLYENYYISELYSAFVALLYTLFVEFRRICSDYPPKSLEWDYFSLFRSNLWIFWWRTEKITSTINGIHVILFIFLRFLDFNFQYWWWTQYSICIHKYFVLSAIACNFLCMNEYSKISK